MVLEPVTLTVNTKHHKHIKQAWVWVASGRGQVTATWESRGQCHCPLYLTSEKPNTRKWGDGSH